MSPSATRLLELLPQRSDWTAARRAPHRDILADAAVHEKVMTAVSATAYLYRAGLVFPDTPTAIDHARHLPGAVAEQPVRQGVS